MNILFFLSILLLSGHVFAKPELILNKIQPLAIAKNPHAHNMPIKMDIIQGLLPDVSDKKHEANLLFLKTIGKNKSCNKICGIEALNRGTWYAPTAFRSTTLTLYSN